MNVPTNQVINITFSEPIQAGTTYNNIKVVNTVTNTAQTITKTISGNILTITSPNAWQQGIKYTITIPAKSIIDLAGNNLTNAFTSNFTIINSTDITPPTISTINPVNNAVNVPTNQVINITFSEPIQAATTYNNINIINTATNTAQTITKTISGNILTITSPNTWQQGIKYTITIPANSITDLAGNNLTNAFTSNFTIINSTDTTPPTIISTDPANNTSTTQTKIVTITFSEPIQAGSAYNNIAVLNTNENSSKDIITSISGNTLTITPTYNWLKFVKYTLTIPANSITDLAGNNLVANYTTSFTIT
ncbi:MAG: Ig-like domain-containing protein [Methanobacterium sp.]|uniref:Ig-like domain-containing protein n=1 Tax=Methanobacterium sp. TaxID=2164 RepID=UPI003C7640E6